MPLARYIIFVGAVLLALLFISDAYLPKSAVADRVSADVPIIRIHSDRKWPERVVYDANLPTIITEPIANTDASIPVPSTATDGLTKVEVREALAQLLPSEPKKPEPKLQPKRKIARRHAPPPMLLVARHPQFSWFGHSTW